MTDVEGNDVILLGSGTQVGGVIGRHYGDDVVIENITINSSEITGSSYTGGIIGYSAEGYFANFSLNDSNITGKSFVGGIFGYVAGWGGSKNRYYMEVDSSVIEGSENYIGGIAGYNALGSNRYWSVTDTEIIANNTNSQYVGGLLGGASQGYFWTFQVEGVTINGNASSVGGAVGNSSAREWLNSGYVANVTVNGYSNVGGLYGSITEAFINDVYAQVDVKASGSDAGGVIGYMANANMTESSFIIQISEVGVFDSSVTAPTKAGGLIGDIETNILRDESFYYDNYIDADVTSTNNSTGSLIIGGRSDENSYIENTYVYRYSTLNGNYVYATNDNIKASQYLVRSDLEQQNTYTNKIGLGTTYWNYASLSEGKYPKIVDSYLYYPELQTGVDLPTDPEITEINSLSVGEETDNNANEAEPNANNIAADNGISTQSVESLPSYKVYPTKVDEINIDFSDIPEGVSFTYYVNGKEKEIVELTQKTYTFKYNYQDKLEIKLTNGQDEETITINPDDVRSEVSLVGNNNAYLLGTNLYINGELQQGEYVNVYEGYALNSSGQVIDIATKQTVTNADDTAKESADENTDVASIVDTMSNITATLNDNAETETEVVTTALQQTTTPLHTYDYKGSNIEVYGTYSTVDGNTKLQIYNVRNGQLSAIANNVDMKIGNSIIDNYNDKEYQTVLTTSGELIDLKEKLQYPNNFLSSNIKQIIQNADAESPEMMVLYNTGKVIVFNYVTGNVIYENEEKADEGLVNYLTRSFSNIWSDYEDRGQEYAKSKELEAKLAKLPVEEALKENNKAETVTSSENNTIVSDNNSNTLTNVNADTNSIIDNNSSGNSSTANNNYSANSNTITDNSYITVYNADTGEYEVYSEDEILNGENENPVSETEKIKQNGLENVYNYDTNEESKPQANGAIIVVSIIAVAVIALVILRKVIYKNSKKNSTKEKHK